MTTKHISEISLNEAFGFATILAALDGIQATFAVPLGEIPGPPALFLVYFLAFRLKMYLDDEGHSFDAAGAPDTLIALASWIVFLISVAAVNAGLDVAAEWFAVALSISTGWVAWSWFGSLGGEGDTKHGRYAWFTVLNFAHLALLAVAVTHPVLFVPLIALVVLDAVVTKKYLSGG